MTSEKIAEGLRGQGHFIPHGATAGDGLRRKNEQKRRSVHLVGLHKQPAASRLLAKVKMLDYILPIAILAAMTLAAAVSLVWLIIETWND